MKILSPMSEQDEAELRSQQQMELVEDEAVVESGRSNRWQRKMERAMTKLSAEVAALREQITTGREWKSRKERSLPAWVGWVAWLVLRHVVIDCAVLAFILLWLRRRKDRRFEDLVRAALKIVREYAGRIVPAR